MHKFFLSAFNFGKLENAPFLGTSSKISNYPEEIRCFIKTHQIVSDDNENIIFPEFPKSGWESFYIQNNFLKIAVFSAKYFLVAI